jgi:hypothetical protein
MSSVPPSADSNVDPDDAPDRGTPRWVKVFGALALVAVVLVVILLLSGGDHGPGRHSDAGGAASQTQPSRTGDPDAAGGHTPPAGAHDP